MKLCWATKNNQVYSSKDDAYAAKREEEKKIRDAWTSAVNKELTKVLPLGYELVTGLSDSETPDWINSLVSRSYQWTSGTSDYAKQHTFSFENFANLLSDVAL
jgi:hypothetical protein